MKLALVSAAAIATLFLAAPAFALNPQPEPPGKAAHDLSMSIQHGTPSTTGAAGHACGTGQANGTVNGKATTGGTARNNSALAGGVNTGLMANSDNCHAHNAHDNGLGYMRR
ncbi:MAG: hypothetical protein JO167_03525 [Alphaproteobacteria bacterium]|nr:hypothetical protein [Alphaproteobacteria bacterium]MBV9904256.1 hypothetical protein [Alphaproteobacteria bacterium]